MARYEDKVLHDVDGIQEYDNPAPGWLMAMFYGSIVFSALYLGYYALSFSNDSMEMGYRAEVRVDRAAIQAHFDANPMVAPSAQELLAGAADSKTVAIGRARFVKTCAACHGEQAQGLIGPNLTDDRWLHGGRISEVFNIIVKGVPAKGMPPWGRALAPTELSALASYIRSVQGSSPAQPRAPEGGRVEPEPLPDG